MTLAGANMDMPKIDLKQKLDLPKLDLQRSDGGGKTLPKLVGDKGPEQLGGAFDKAPKVFDKMSNQFKLAGDDPQKLQELQKKLGLDDDQFQNLMKAVGRGGQPQPAAGAPAPAGDAGGQPPAQGQPADGAGGQPQAGDAGGQQGGGILQQILQMLQQLMQVIQGGQQPQEQQPQEQPQAGGAEQPGAAQEAQAQPGAQDQQQLVQQIAGAKTMDQLQKVIQPLVEQSGGDPSKLPPEVTAAIKKKVAELGGGQGM